MELRVLQYFLAVAREENITHAAALLNITQPTLSRQLMQMEEELGVRLFHRGRHNILLTEEGLLLRRRAQEIVDLAVKTENEPERRGGSDFGGDCYRLRGNTEHEAAFRNDGVLPSAAS